MSLKSVIWACDGCQKELPTTERASRMANAQTDPAAIWTRTTLLEMLPAGWTAIAYQGYDGDRGYSREWNADLCPDCLKDKMVAAAKHSDGHISVRRGGAK